MTRPLFRATIQVYETEKGGPVAGCFSFPESGMRAVPMEFPGIPGLNTVVMQSEPNLRVTNGSAFEAECGVLAEDSFRGRISVGAEFHLWDGRHIARGRVIEICPTAGEPAA